VLQIKREHDRTRPVDDEMRKKTLALRKWESLNPDRLRYRMILTATDAVTADQMHEAMRFAEEAET
jgi:hypothetical protein